MTSINVIPKLRTVAEQRLRQISHNQVHSLDSSARVLHELQVHQIELQIQNEVLSETLAECETLRLKYQDLYDFAPVGYLTLSTAGNIVDCNRCASKMLGITRGQTASRRFQEFFCPSSVDALALLLDSLSGSESMEEFRAHELKLLNPMIPLERYVNAQGRSYIDHANSVRRIRVVLMDVTALKQATDDVVRTISKFGDLGPN